AWPGAPASDSRIMCMVAIVPEADSPWAPADGGREEDAATPALRSDPPAWAAIPGPSAEPRCLAPELFDSLQPDTRNRSTATMARTDARDYFRTRMSLIGNPPRREWSSSRRGVKR